MAVKKKQTAHADTSTQRYLPFSGIRENIILMKDDSTRIVLRCSAINFLLKNSDEQDSIIVSFQRFLNSIDFPIQILVRSKKLDIESYIAKLNNRAVKQTNTLLQNQTYEYIAYLKKLIEVAQIMKKEFYIILPHDFERNNSVKDDSILGVFNNFWESINQSQTASKIKAQLQVFAKHQKELWKRVNAVKTWLENMWIKAEPLTKQELVAFLTDYYNPRLDSLSVMGEELSSYDVIPS